MLWYFGNMVLSSFALIMGTSDNAYLSLAAIFGLAPLWLFRTKTGLRRYVISAATFVTVILCINGINQAYASSVLGIDSAFGLIAKQKFLPVIAVLLWIVSAALVAMSRKPQALMNRTSSDEMNKIAVYIWLGVIVVVCLVVVFVLYDANAAGHADKYGAISSYVVFDDNWGTQRGYVWKRAIELFTKKLTPLQKVFGYGADTFALLMQYYFPADMQNGKMVIFDSAHNEYLHYLVTIGFAGMASYIVFMVSSVVAMAKRMKEQPVVAAVMLAVLAYMIQATVNINLPIAMPIILQLLAMGVGCRKTAVSEEKKD